MNEFEYWSKRVIESMEEFVAGLDELNDSLRELNKGCEELEIFIQNTADTSEQ